MRNAKLTIMWRKWLLYARLKANFITKKAAGKLKAEAIDTDGLHDKLDKLGKELDEEQRINRKLLKKNQQLMRSQLKQPDHSVLESEIESLRKQLQAAVQRAEAAEEELEALRQELEELRRLGGDNEELARLLRRAEEAL